MTLSYAETPVKGKPLERVGRKVTGLRSVRTEYDRRAPGVRSSSVVSVQFTRAHPAKGLCLCVALRLHVYLSMSLPCATRCFPGMPVLRLVAML